MGVMYFELPTEPKQLAAIVRAIPEDWSRFDGYLLATRAIHAQGIISPKTVLSLSRFCLTNQLLNGNDAVPYEDENSFRDRKVHPAPDLVGVMLEGKWVAGVYFNEAGYQNRDILPVSTIKELAAGYIARGYKGWLGVYSGFKDNDKGHWSERFHFDHKENQPHITLMWNEQYKGRKENLEQLLVVVQNLGLKEVNVLSYPV